MLLRTVLASVALAVVLGAPAVSQDNNIRVERDLAYGPHDAQNFDLYLPASIDQETPLIVFFHGGHFSSGNKDRLSEQGESFAREGVIFVAANHRLFPDTRFPGFIEDAAAAVAHAVEITRDGSSTIRPLVLSGWSSGAYIAGLLTYDGNWLLSHGIPRDAVKGLIGLSGPYSGGYCLGQRCEHIFPEDLRSDWRIVNYIDAGDPPALLAVSAGDIYVPARHHEELGGALAKSGIEVEILVLDSRAHARTLGMLKASESEVRQHVSEFLKRVIGG